MADNKFLTRLKGKQIAKSSVQIDNDKLSPVFGDMPVGSDGLENIIQQSNSSTVVAKGAQNWYLSGDSMVLSDNDQYVSEFKVSGQGLWVNSSYELTSNMVIAPHSKWVLRFCGDNLLNSAGHKVSISVLIKTGTTTLASKSFMLEEQANFFCKVLEFDFDNTYESICKILSGASLTVQVLCGDEGASATIYNGKTTLTLLQRMVDADTVAFNGTSLVDIMAGYIPEDYFNRYVEQVEDGAEAQPVFTRDGDTIDLSGWEDKASDQVAEHNTSDEAHADIRTELAGKQAQLTAGQNIVIDENNVISATGEISVAFESITGDPYDNANLTTALNAKADESDLQTHIEDKTNPHEVTKAQVGLGNVDNTADLDKPISTATQTALNAKQDTLVAGTNIQIAADGKTISATDTTYTAGTGIDITNNVISNTQTSAEWGNITGTLSNQTDLQAALDLKANSADLATVATSGSYNDLEDKPTIPAAQVNSDWNAVSGVAQILNKPTLATVATSGSYNDLTNKPTIPTVPTNVSAFTNDADYQTGTQVSTAISTHNTSNTAHSDIRTAVASKSTVSVSATGTATDEVQYITIDGVEKKLAGGGSEEDNLSITKNASDKIQTVGVIDQNDTTAAIKTWTGSKAEYLALASKDADTMYIVKDDGIVVDNSYLVPTGSVIPFAGTTAPDGWLICDGSAISRTDYGKLFAIIGTTYGSGDGSTTFNIPNSNPTREVVAYQEPTSSNNYTWYRLYSDGWIEQGGQFTTTGRDSFVTTPIEMRDTNYQVLALAYYSSGNWRAVSENQHSSRTTNRFYLRAVDSTNTGITSDCFWQVSGISNRGTTQQNRKIIKY
ncbi:MAG: phage tail protein [Alphaproteobacteria bacterium]|nr:phage tail protein [Alphaproteobacteria bacterium]